MEKYYLFYFLAFIAEVIGTVSGFGSSILFVPVASMFFDFKAVLGITAVFHIFSNLSKIFLFKKGIDKNIVYRLGIPAIIFVIIGSYLSKFVPAKELEITMSIIVLGLAIFLITSEKRHLVANNNNLILSGIGSGFIAGLIGTGGVIRGLMLSAFNLEKNLFIATSAAIDMGVDVSRTIVYFSNGYLEKKYLFIIPFLVVISILGSYIGKLIVNRINHKYFRYTVLVVIIITTIFTLGKYLFFLKK